MKTFKATSVINGEQYFEEVLFSNPESAGEELVNKIFPLRLFNLDPHVPKGTEVREDELEIVWQMYDDNDGYEEWTNSKNPDIDRGNGYITRQAASLKEKAEDKAEQVSEEHIPQPEKKAWSEKGKKDYHHLSKPFGTDHSVPAISANANGGIKNREKEDTITLKVIHDKMDEIVLENKYGDTYTSSSEELMDFIASSERDKNGLK